MHRPVESFPIVAHARPTSFEIGDRVRPIIGAYTGRTGVVRIVRRSDLPVVVEFATAAGEWDGSISFNPEHLELA